MKHDVNIWHAGYMIFVPWERVIPLPKGLQLPFWEPLAWWVKTLVTKVHHLSLIRPCEEENIVECMYPPSLSSVNKCHKMSIVYMEHIFFTQSPKNPRWVSGMIQSLTLVNTVTNEDVCAGVSVVFSHTSLGVHPGVGEMSHMALLLLVFLGSFHANFNKFNPVSPALHKNFQGSFLMTSC